MKADHLEFLIGENLNLRRGGCSFKISGGILRNLRSNTEK
jgi:hypothetical protein